VNALTSRRAIVRLILMGMFAFSLSGWRLAFASGGEPEAVVEAWNARQNEIRTLHFSWSGVHFRAGVAAVALRPAKVLPRPEATFDMRMTFTTDGSGRIRLEDYGKDWSDKQEAYVPKETKDVFDGQLRRVFFPKGGEFPNAHVTSTEACASARDIRLFPIRLAYRAFDTTMGVLDEAGLTLTETKSIVDDRSCRVLRQRGDWFEHTIWVDPARSFVPLRYTRSRQGVVRTQVEISYSEDKEYGWVPTSWNIVLLNKQTSNIQESWSGTVTEYKLNHPIPDVTFQLTYPPGTWVHDYVTDQEYIIRGGGNRRPILRGEYTGDNYEQLLHSDPPSLAKPWGLRRVLGILSGIGGLLAVLMYLGWRVRSK